MVNFFEGYYRLRQILRNNRKVETKRKIGS